MALYYLSLLNGITIIILPQCIKSKNKLVSHRTWTREDQFELRQCKWEDFKLHSFILSLLTLSLVCWFNVLFVQCVLSCVLSSLWCLRATFKEKWKTYSLLNWKWMRFGNRQHSYNLVIERLQQAPRHVGVNEHVTFTFMFSPVQRYRTVMCRLISNVLYWFTLEINW